MRFVLKSFPFLSSLLAVALSFAMALQPLAAMAQAFPDGPPGQGPAIYPSAEPRPSNLDSDSEGEDASSLTKLAEDLITDAETKAGIHLNLVEHKAINQAVSEAVQKLMALKGSMTSPMKELFFDNPDSRRNAMRASMVKWFVVLPALFLTGHWNLYPEVDLLTWSPMLLGLIIGANYSRIKAKQFYAAGMDPRELRKNLLTDSPLDLNLADLIKVKEDNGKITPDRIVVAVTKKNNVPGTISVKELESGLDPMLLRTIRARGLDRIAYRIALIRENMKEENENACRVAKRLRELNLADQVKEDPLLRFYLKTDILITRARVEAARSPSLQWRKGCKEALLSGWNKVKAAKVSMELSELASELRYFQLLACGNAFGLGTRQIDGQYWKKLDEYRSEINQRVSLLKAL